MASNTRSASSGSSAACSSCTSTGYEPKPAGPSHPLNQLNQEEIRKAVELIKKHAQENGISQELDFISVSLKEPPKRYLLPYLNGNGKKPARKAWSVFTPDGINSTYEVLVNLDTEQVEQLVLLPPGTQPSFSSDTPFIIQDIVKSNPAVIERAKKAGVMNMDHLISDEWTYGHNGTELDKQKRRLMNVYFYARKFDGDNHYAHPLDFIVTIDMISKEIIDIIDLPVCAGTGSQGPSPKCSDAERPIKPPQESHNFDPRVLPKDFYRTDVQPIKITQPKGPSFQIDGNKISWQKWEMIVGFNFREGLTLHNINFQDGDNKRGILYRAALSEMVVPYGDPRKPYYNKSAFDLGENGIGYCANSLVNGCDCLGEIRYMDFVFADSKGEPNVIRNAICIHEEDTGLLHKHTDIHTEDVTIARSRRLVVSFIATVTNYDYGCYWNFYQDGTIVFDVKATGLLSTHALCKEEVCKPGNFGTVVAPRLIAPYHQHIFCARLDPMIDGQNNTVVMQDVVPFDAQPGTDADPFGIGFTTKSTVLERASESGTDTDTNLVRSWVMTNESVIHPHTKKPVGWKLVTPGFCGMLAKPSSGVYKRAGFARHSVWVTPYNDEQLYAAGKYVNQDQGDRDGVHVWAERNDGNIRNADIVLWHTFGLTHIPRVEDFPLMPVEGVSFMLRPTNFFNASPVLDVPPPPPKRKRGDTS